jgi:hypothetical protein
LSSSLTPHALNAVADDASTRVPTRTGHDVDAYIESGLLRGSPYGHLTGIVRLARRGKAGTRRRRARAAEAVFGGRVRAGGSGCLRDEGGRGVLIRRLMGRQDRAGGGMTCDQPAGHSPRDPEVLSPSTVAGRI